MKISEMTNDQATEAMIRLASALSNICDDEEMVAIIEEYAKNKDTTPFIRLVGRILPNIAGYALKKHKSDFYEVIGALTFSTAAEVGKMNFKETIAVLRESWDEVLSGFFTSSVKQIKETVEES